MKRADRILLTSALLTLLTVGSLRPAHAADPVASGPESAGTRTAEIRGEVGRPGTYEMREGETLSSLILRAGGYSDNAWLPGAALYRKSEKASQRRELAGIAARLEAAVRGAPDRGAESDRLVRLARTLRTLAPAGRVPVRLSHPRLMINSPEDLALEEGDNLYVPPRPRTVRMAGAVRNPGEYPLPPGARLPGLAGAAGGFLPDADRDGAILLKADGTARILAAGWIVWNGDAGRWEFSPFRKDRPRIEAGDTVFVPRGPGGTSWPGGVRDYRRTTMRILEITGTGAAW